MEKTLLGLSELHARFCANARYFYVKQGSKAGYLSLRSYLVDKCAIHTHRTINRLEHSYIVLLCGIPFFCWGPANLTPKCIGHEEQMVLYLPMNFYLGQRIRTGKKKAAGTRTCITWVRRKGRSGFLFPIVRLSSLCSATVKWSKTSLAILNKVMSGH